MLNASLISLLVLVGCGDESPSTTETTAKMEQSGKKVEEPVEKAKVDPPKPAQEPMM